VWSDKDMKELEKLTNGSDIIIISDEVYQHIIFDGVKHQSIARYRNLADRSFLIGSFGKTFHATGWKIGYAMGPAQLMKEFNKVHQFVTFAVNHPVQKAIATFLEDEENYMHIGEMYQAKRDLFVNALSGSRFKIKPAQGTYFQSLDYSNITNQKDTEFAKKLTIENKIASIPVSVFYRNSSPDKVLRFCFAKQDETLLKAAEILCEL